MYWVGLANRTVEEPAGPQQVENVSYLVLGNEECVSGESCRGPPEVNRGQDPNKW